VVLDGAGYNRENLRALEEAGGGSWSERGGAWDASSWPRTS
jgi:hypothetical protein